VLQKTYLIIYVINILTSCYLHIQTIAVAISFTFFRSFKYSEKLVVGKIFL